MRFTHSLTFNSVPEWRDHYLHYASLKKSLHTLERVRFEEKNLENARFSAKERNEPFAEEDALKSIRSQATTIENDFHQGFAADLNAVSTFYLEKRKEFADALNRCRADIPTRPISTSAEAANKGAIQLCEESLKGVYSSLNDLTDFLEMNWNGFERVVNRYERITVNAASAKGLRDLLISSQLKMSDVEALKSDISICEDLWIRLHPSTNRDLAIKDLRSDLRERLAFERATVWQEMVQAQRKAISVEPAPAPAVKAAHAAHHAQVWWKQMLSLLLAFASLILVVLIPIFPDRATNNCAAMVLCLIILWCSEALPLYATSMLLPALAVILKVQRNPVTGEVLNTKDATKEIFKNFFSHNIMLLIGGFTMAAALSKYGVTKSIAHAILKRSSKKPRWVILVNMIICTLASMFIGNIGAAVLSFGLLHPILRTLAYDHPLAKALVLSIAYAGNVGGLISSISSPQNIVCNAVLKDDPIGFFAWLLVSFPTAIACTLTTWLVLLFVFPVGDTDITVFDSTGKKVTDPKERRIQWYISGVAILTITLFCLSKQLAPYVGEMGIIAVLPVVAYFGANLLGKDDFNSFLWNVIMLAMGGTALGTCVMTSGLLETIGLMIRDRIAGFSMYTVILIFCFVITVVTSFISHTVGSMILLPLMLTIGQGMPDARPRVIVFAACFATSSGMGLPISGFPNMTAVSQEDAQGRPYVNTKDFAKTGLISSVFFYFAIVFVGVPLMMLLGI